MKDDVEKRTAPRPGSRHQSTVSRVVLSEVVRQPGQPDQVCDSQAGTLAEGYYCLERFPSGLIVQVSQSAEHSDRQVSAAIHACTSLIIVLKGHLNFTYDDAAFFAEENKALAVHLKRTSCFERQLDASGQPVTKLHLVMKPDWFRHYQTDSSVTRKLDQYLCHQHLGHFYWQPSAQCLALCYQLLKDSHEADSLLRRIKMEHLATGVLYEFLQQLDQLPDQSHVDNDCVDADRSDQSDRDTEQQAVEVPSDTLTGQASDTEATSSPAPADGIPEALAFIEQQLHQTLSLNQIARATGLSESVLQRRFKQSTGITVFEYLRERRLDVARRALMKRSMSISEAAWMAGFNHVSNFTTAFKRRYGVTPGELHSD